MSHCPDEPQAQPPARRAFLTGRRPDRHPWSAFVRAVRACGPGDLVDFGWRDGTGRAAWTLADSADFAEVTRLCRAYGVRLALGGMNHADAQTDTSVLWVEPASPTQGCVAMPDAPGRWLVQPGCSIAEARAAGLRQFDAVHDGLTVAAWLADRRICSWPTGYTWRSGLVLASVLLADGSTAHLGPFGAGGGAPLDTLLLQRVVPALFQLGNEPLARPCLGSTDWPARYRLDALFPSAGRQVNLAHLLLGHGGDLAWVRWMVFEAVPEAPPQPATSRAQFRAPETVALDGGGELAVAAAELDAAVKALFDPAGLFPHPGQRLD